MKKFSLFRVVIALFIPQLLVAQQITIDGSSTVYPLTKAIVSMYSKTSQASTVKIDVSGTGGGFKRFLRGETSINNSSRKPNATELNGMEKNGVTFHELPLALDGIALVTNKKNNFATNLSLDELRAIWRKNSTIKTWNDVRKIWPNEPIKLVGPGLSSGTREYFAEVLYGDVTQLSTNYEMSEDDDELERDVENNEFALSFFGIAYVAKNNNQVNVLAIYENDTSILPTYNSIQSRKYPLTRTLYLHINQKHMQENPQLIEFLNVYIKSLTNLAKAAGYIPLDARIYKKHLDEINGVEKRKTAR